MKVFYLLLQYVRWFLWFSLLRDAISSMNVFLIGRLMRDLRDLQRSVVYENTID